MEKEKIEDFISKLEKLEDIGDNIDSIAYNLRKEMEKELKNDNN